MLSLLVSAWLLRITMEFHLTDLPETFEFKWNWGDKRKKLLTKRAVNGMQQEQDPLGCNKNPVREAGMNGTKRSLTQEAMWYSVSTVRHIFHIRLFAIHLSLQLLSILDNVPHPLQVLLVKQQSTFLARNRTGGCSYQQWSSCITIFYCAGKLCIKAYSLNKLIEDLLNMQVLRCHFSMLYILLDT